MNENSDIFPDEEETRTRSAGDLRDHLASTFDDIDTVDTVELAETLDNDGKPTSSMLIRLHDGRLFSVVVSELPTPAEPEHTTCIYCHREIDVTEDEYVVLGNAAYLDREGDLPDCAHEACDREAHPERYDEDGER